MFAIMEGLDQIPDPREQKKVKYKLTNLLFMSICAIFCGATSWEDMSTWAECHEEWLSKHIDMREGIPCYSTFRRLFMVLKPEHFSAIAQYIIGYHKPSLESEDQICIDGKSLRGTKCLSKEVRAVQMVSAFSMANDIILAEVSTDSKSNEITAIPLLLELLDLEGATVSIDAIACNEKIISQIVNQGGHYLIGLKKNQPTLHAAVEAYAQSEGTHFTHLIKDYFDDSHGRLVRRRYFAFDLPESIKALGFSKMTTVVATETISSNQYVDKAATAEWRYYISDHGANNPQLASYTRDHWKIESTHWLLDVHLSDDKDKKYEKNATENFAKVKRLLLNLVKIKPPKGKKRSVRSQLKQVGWNLDYLDRLLFG